jgi:hypothetical protein
MYVPSTPLEIAGNYASMKIDSRKGATLTTYPALRAPKRAASDAELVEWRLQEQ